MLKEYRVTKSNSTVCGSPARNYDWTSFCWDGSDVMIQRCSKLSCKHKHILKAPLPSVDTFFIEEGSEYLHVPYDWKNMGTVYRVRPTMTVGKTYRGHLVKSIKAINRSNVWYWSVEME